MFVLNASAKFVARTLCTGASFAAIGLACAQAPGNTPDISKAQKEDNAAFAQAMQQLGQTPADKSALTAQQSKEIAEAMKEARKSIHQEMDSAKMKAEIRDALRESREEMEKEMKNLPNELKELKEIKGVDSQQITMAITEAMRSAEKSMKEMSIEGMDGIGKIQMDGKDFDTKGFKFNVPKFKFHMPAIHIHIPKMHFKQNGKDVKVGEIKVDVPTINIDMKAVNVDIPAIHVKVPPVKVDKS